MMDFLLQHAVEPTKIQSTLATFYQLTHGLNLDPWVEEEHYHLVAFTGDVAWLLSVYMDSPDKMALARFLAHALRTKVIVSDESSNPYTWVLLNEEGKEWCIYQDPVDEQEATFVVDSRHKHLLTQDK